MTCLCVTPLAIVGPFLTFLVFQGAEEDEFQSLIQRLIQDPRGLDYLILTRRSECEPLLFALAESFAPLWRQDQLDLFFS